MYIISEATSYSPNKPAKTMNTTKELFYAFGKGSEHFRMTSKQGAWFLSLAKKENLIEAFGDYWYVLVDGKTYRVGKTYIAMGCYGGGVGRKKASGNYNVEPVQTES